MSRRFAPVRSILWTAVLTLTAVLGACGKKPDDGGGGQPAGKVESAFLSAAQASGIPVRFLMAIGYLESRLVPDNATASYVSLDDGSNPVARGTIMTQTAFGLSYETLGLDPAQASSAVLEVQVEAYARWLSAMLKADGVTLPANPRTPDEMFAWLQNLALLHRQGVEQRRTVQIMFARELVEIMNVGFTWQDPRGDETLRLSKEFPPIDVESPDFPQNGKNWFKLAYSSGIDLRDVPYFRLATTPSGTAVNLPRRVEVIHCPLTLSACLELQTRSQDGDDDVGEYVQLAAHYAIPADPELFDRRPIIQVASHNQAVKLTDSRGENVLVQDAIVIMLTGNSGRTVGGTRMPAVPTWFSSEQLLAMAGLVNDVCTHLSLSAENPVDRDGCMRPDGDLGLRFRHQGSSEEYRWGDVADFDETIFNAYVRNPGGLTDEVAFELARGNREFSAGQQIPLTVLFNSSAREVQLERLTRCQSGKLVWEPVRNHPVRGETRAVLTQAYFDGGPNRNGEQFFRARVYGKDTKLMGWAIEQVFLKGFEKEPAFASEKYCSP